MLDEQGHVTHIDFGFVFGQAPGKDFSIETAPFKLTTEMVELMGGIDSDDFGTFIGLVVLALYELHKHAETIISLVEQMSERSCYPCFVNATSVDNVLALLRGRLGVRGCPCARLRLAAVPSHDASLVFQVGLGEQELAEKAVQLVQDSAMSTFTEQYDNFQRLTNGIIQ